MTKRNNNLLIILTSLLLPIVSASYYQPCEYLECFLFPEGITSNDNNKLSRGMLSNNIMDVLERNGFTIMTDLLKKSGMADEYLTNSTSDPVTFFAVTDAGYNELKLKAPSWYNTFSTNLPRTALVFQNHIVKGLLPELRPGMSAMSLDTPILFHTVDNGKTLAVNGSRILSYLEASNGIIYVVANQILEDMFSMLPWMPLTIGEEVSVMLKALETSGLSDIVADHTAGPFTMFVPSDEAVSRVLPQSSLDSMMKSPLQLRKFLMNHLLPNALFVNEQDKTPVSGILKTLGGAFIPFMKNADGTMTVGKNKAKMTFPNRAANNGVIHIIDQAIVVD